MSARRGTAVLELIFGLAVVALVASIGTTTLTLIGSDRLARRDAAVLDREAATRRALIDWLAGAHASLGGTFQVIDAKRFGRDADVLIFTTTAPTPLMTAETTVRLYVESDRGTDKGLVAELTSWPGGPAARADLDSAVVGLDVQCLTNLLGERRWVASWLSADVIPRGVELRLRRAPNAARSAWVALPIVVALEGGR